MPSPLALPLALSPTKWYSGLPRSATWNLPSGRLKTVSLPMMPLPLTTFVCSDLTVSGGQKPRARRVRGLRALLGLGVAREVVERHALLGVDDDLLAQGGVLDGLDGGLRVAPPEIAALAASATSPVAMAGVALMVSMTPDRVCAFPPG
jgi:hypothetical protein